MCKWNNDPESAARDLRIIQQLQLTSSLPRAVVFQIVSEWAQLLGVWSIGYNPTVSGPKIDASYMLLILKTVAAVGNLIPT
jgi:hypothetical protein